jgi:hypothetical protein
MASSSALARAAVCLTHPGCWQAETAARSAKTTMMILVIVLAISRYIAGRTSSEFEQGTEGV